MTRNPWGLLVSILAFTFALYYAGAGGPFLLDDFANIVHNQTLQIEDLSFSSLWHAALSSNAGMLRRPVAMFSFALNVYFDGLHPFYFKIVNIAIHLATALLLFFLTERLLARLNASHPGNAFSTHYGAALIVVLWALHPLHVSTVLYTVQRMTELTALFTVAGVLLYVQGREAMLDGKNTAGLFRIFVGLVGCGALAILSKENGALLPVFLLLVESVFFRFSANKNKAAARALFALLIVSSLAILSYLIYFWLAPAPLARDFNQTQRLLTETRILFDYIGQILLPRVNDMSLFDSGTVISRGLWSPPETFFAALALLILTAGSIYAIWKKIWLPLAFAIGWFVVGHLLESTVIPLELRFEHRNYLPSYGLLFAFGYGMMNQKISQRLRPGIYFALIAAVVIGLAIQLQQRVGQWSLASSFYRFELTQHPSSPRAWSSLAFSETWQGHYAGAIELYARAAEVEPKEAGHLLALLNVSIHGLGIPPDPAIAAEVTRKLKAYPLTSYGESQLMLFAQATVQESKNIPSRFDLIYPILSAAATNQNWTSTANHAACFYFMADLAIYRKEIELAIQNLRDGLAYEPHQLKRLMLIEVLMDAKKRDEARAEFDKIDSRRLGGEVLKHYGRLRERLK